jgi:hypothetical protein
VQFGLFKNPFVYKLAQFRYLSYLDVNTIKKEKKLTIKLYYLHALTKYGGLVSVAYSFPTKKELNSTLPMLVFADINGAEWCVI